jgi:dTDP-4-amino-4,6-dideoxygalactose transaminase
VEALITPQTSGIIGVHLWGRPCDTETLADVAQQHDLKLLYDAAHAFYNSHAGRMIGNFGEAEVFSFHATKFLNSFEGGAVTTNDNALAAKLRSMRNFGFCDVDQVAYVGTNGKMDEVSAAMGLTSLENLDDVIQVNHRNYQAYQAALQGLPGVELVSHDETERNNYQYVIVKLDPHETGISRDQLLSILAAENVMARRYFYPGCHQMEPYASRLAPAPSILPETEKLSRCVLALPTGTAIVPQDIRHICGLIRLAVQQGPTIKR